MKNITKIGIGVVLLIGVIAFAAIGLNQPSYTFTMDINPSIEIKANRLDRVVEINPLNEDAKNLLQDFELDDKSLQKTIEDLADLMVLKGYISGGDDNLIMITVNDQVTDQEAVDKLNQAIVAYLQNKQIEATILTQSIPEGYNNSQPVSGREIVANKIKDLDDDSVLKDFSSMTLNEIVQYAEERDIDLKALFSTIIGNIQTTGGSNKGTATNVNEKQIISSQKAKEIALGQVGGKGTIVEFEFDYDDGRPEYEIEIKANGKEYEIEIDGYTGKILKFEVDGDDDNKDKKQVSSNKQTSTKKQSTNTKKQVISADQAKKIALAEVGGKGTIVEFEFDYDDGRPEYEIEIKANGKEYEIEIDGYTGKILEFEVDDDDDKDKKQTSTKKQSTSTKKQVISADQAKKIALAEVGGKGTIVEFEFDYDDGRPEYEIEIKANGKEYEIEIDGYTGKIIDFEVDDD